MIGLWILALLAGLVTGQENGARDRAFVRIHQERSTESDLYASVDAFGDTHNLALKKVLLPSIRVHELISGQPGAFRSVDVTENQQNTRFYFDKKKGSLLYLNSENNLEGMITHSLGLRYEKGEHIASKISKKPGGLSAERTIIDDSKDVPNLNYVNRGSRQGTSYSVEVAVMVDSILFSKFASVSDLINYIKVYWYLVDRRFATVDCASISIILTQIFYSTSTAQDRQFMDVTTFNSSDVDASINIATKFFVNESLGSFDVAHIMSGRDFYRISGDTKYYNNAGLAYRPGVCRRFSTGAYNTGLSEDSGFYDGVLFTAHEIGHNLGAEHDGTGNAESCSAADGYLMSYEVNSYKHFYFSPCSMSVMCGIYNDPYGTCLHTISNSGSSYSLVENLVGSDFTLDEQCQYRTGRPNAYVDTSVSPDHHCFRLRCRYQEGATTYTTISGYPAIEGTYCYPVINGITCEGVGRQCIDGRCQIRSP